LTTRDPWFSPADGTDPLAEETLESNLAFNGDFLQVHKDRVRAPDGHLAPREYLTHPGAVMVVPLLDDGRVVLERQYRYPLRRGFVEFPAGKIDPGEGLLTCAQRELREETGYVGDTWVYLGGFHNAIGYCNEKIEVFLARGLRQVGGQNDAGEVLEVFAAAHEELKRRISSGEITDVKTLIGSYWLDEYLAGRRGVPA
jgi:ADP-ribose pyrophosphatase